MKDLDQLEDTRLYDEPERKPTIWAEHVFANIVEAYAFRIHEWSKSKGWWDEERNDGEIIALIHSELSEGLESLRHGDPPSEKIPAFSGMEEEYADAIIRILDHCAAKNYRVGQAIVAKVVFNEKREHKHGGKRF